MYGYRLPHYVRVPKLIAKRFKQSRKQRICWHECSFLNQSFYLNMRFIHLRMTHAVLHTYRNQCCVHIHDPDYTSCSTADICFSNFDQIRSDESCLSGWVVRSRHNFPKLFRYTDQLDNFFWVFDRHVETAMCEQK